MWGVARFQRLDVAAFCDIWMLFNVLVLCWADWVKTTDYHRLTTTQFLHFAMLELQCQNTYQRYTVVIIHIIAFCSISSAFFPHKTWHKICLSFYNHWWHHFILKTTHLYIFIIFDVNCFLLSFLPLIFLHDCYPVWRLDAFLVFFICSFRSCIGV